MMTFDAIAQYFGKQADVLLEPDSLAGLDQMLFADASKFGIVQQQIGKLASLLYQIDPRHSGDTLFKARQAEQLTQNETGIVETQGLIEITGKQIMLHFCSTSLFSFSFDSVWLHSRSISPLVKTEAYVMIQSRT